MNDDVTLEQFIAAQQAVIAECGLNSFLPTLLVESFWGCKINVLADVPDDGEIESVAVEWAQRVAGRKNYFLAFRLNGDQFKVVARKGKLVSERIISYSA
jgi:hypothetical protein